MYALANSWVEVVFHFGATTSYALTEFVVFWRLNLFSLFRVDASMRSDNNQQPLCILSRQQTPPCFFIFTHSDHSWTYVRRGHGGEAPPRFTPSRHIFILVDTPLILLVSFDVISIAFIPVFARSR